MFNLEIMLANKFLATKQYKKVINTQLITDDLKEKIYFVIEVSEDTKSKMYKQDITSYVINHGGVQQFFRSLVVSEMLLMGYLLIPIEGGFLCVGGEEVYSLINNECTCRAYLNNPSKMCKHLLFKEGLLEQRARINNWKLQNIK